MHKSQQRGGQHDHDNSGDAGVVKIFTEQFKGIELNCLVGNIMTCDTAIGIICDSRFTLNGGLARCIKDVGGIEFTANLHKAREQNTTTTIAVRSTTNLRSNYVILYPVRSVDRNLLNEAYIGIFNKARELSISNLTIPLLGTGQLGLSVNAAINYLRIAFSGMNDFGHLNKLQFIDQNENTMRVLINEYLDQLIKNQGGGHHSNSEQQQQCQICGRDSLPDLSFHAIGSGAPDSPIGLYPKINHDYQNHQGTSSNLTPPIGAPSASATIPPAPTINPNIRFNFDAGLDQSDMNEEETEDEDISITTDSVDDNSDDSDLEDSSDAIGEISSADENLWSTDSDDDSQQMDSTNSVETPKQQKRRIDEEKGFWKKVIMENLGKNADDQLSQKPMSSSAQQNVQLDDSTMPCSICLTDMREEQENNDAIVQLTLCTHMFHEECIRAAFKVKKQCPLCMCFYGNPIGFQPLDATMHVQQISGKVHGHPDAKGFHEITYHIPSGIQSENHIRPGEAYRSTVRLAYLPNNEEGTQVLKLLQLAFKRRLTFTIGDSVTTGRKNVPVWNGIHHKTNKDGGPQCYGYPDPHYFQRVKEELALVGVRSDQL